MDDKIKRINELFKKSKEEGLTQEEKDEQKTLRAEYVAGFKSSLKAQIENTVVVDADGNETPLSEIAKKNK